MESHLNPFLVTMLPKQIQPMYKEALLRDSSWREVKHGTRVKILVTDEEKEPAIHCMVFFFVFKLTCSSV
jgi:hypothetical protein